jgi:hypothetical protein
LSDALRVRLEGALEVLEAELRSLHQLRALATRRWEAHSAEVLGLLERVRASMATRDEALAKAQRVPEAERVLERLEDARVALVARLDSVLKHTAVSRVSGLAPKLAIWEELARNVGPPRDAVPLSEGRGFMRSREWWLTFGAIGAVVALHQPLLSFLLLGLGFVWRDFSRHEVGWRMFEDCVELFDEEYTVRIPLASVEAVTHDPTGLSLKALRDVTLHGDESLFEFGLKLQRMHAEQQLRARYKDSTGPALWLHATLQQDDIRVEGCVVVCEGGFVFMPERAYDRAWAALIGAARVMPGEPLEALRSLPSRLIGDRMQGLRELPGVVQLDGYGEAAWQPLGDILMVQLEAERQLFIKCSPSTQERLRQLREARRA